MKIAYIVVLAVAVACVTAAPSRRPGNKDNEKPTPATIYNGGRHNGQHNKGGINGRDNKGSYNGNYNTGGVNGNGNGGSHNGNGNVGGGMNGNGNGGDGEVDWQSFLDGLDLGTGHVKGTGYTPDSWRKHVTAKPSTGRKTTGYASKNTTPTPTEKTTKNPYKYGYEEGYGPGDWQKYLNGGDDSTTASWNNQDSDYWNNFNNQFQPGGKYHWTNYLPKDNDYNKYSNYQNYNGGW